MRKFPVSIALLSALIAASPFASRVGVSQDASEFIIVGRVVDGNGRPFTDVDIFLEPIVYRSKAFDRFIEPAEQKPDGSFRIIRYKTKAARSDGDFLFVSADKTGDAMDTVRPPFDWTRRYDHSFNGKLVRYGKDDIIDVGDVQVQFWYGKVVLRPVPKIAWEDAYLRIREARGHIVFFQSFSKDELERYIVNDRTKLMISLPEGKWRVELVNYTRRQIFATSGFFTVSRNQTADVRMFK